MISPCHRAVEKRYASGGYRGMTAPHVLQTPEPLDSSPNWTKESARAVFHLMQIHYRLDASLWAQQFSIVGYSGEPVPDIEALTLPLILFRQVVGDELLHRVEQIYVACLPSSSHTAFITARLSELDSVLCTPLPITGELMRAFFEAVLYGTCLFHAPDRDKTRFPNQAALIRRLEKQFSKADIMNDLQYTLNMVWRYVSEIAEVCRIDYRPRTDTGSCEPEMPMLDKVFRIPESLEDSVGAFLMKTPPTALRLLGEPVADPPQDSCPAGGQGEIS